MDNRDANEERVAPPLPDEVRRALGYIGSIKTEKKAASSARNGKHGGRPKGTPQSAETRAKISAARKNATSTQERE